jgi:UDP-N-acetylglucosamine 2-epimerase
MSMPEEVTRLCLDAISDILFTTDTLAVEKSAEKGRPMRRSASSGTR